MRAVAQPEVSLRRWPLIALFGPAALFATVFAIASVTAKTPADRVGYFKSPAGDRVMAYHAPDLTEAQAREVLDAAQATPGKVTVAVVYVGDVLVPRDALDRARDLPAALNLIGSDPWDGWSYRLRVNSAGQRTYD